MSYVGEIKDGVLKRYVDAPKGKVKLSSEATKIGSNAFKGKKSLTEIELHDAVTEIGNSAFENCRGLTKINFPESLRKIGTQAFMGCEKLKDVQLPDMLEQIGGFAFSDTAWLQEADGDVYAAGFLLHAVPRDGEFAIAPGTRGVVGGAFEGCADLRRLTIPESVTFLGDGLFWARFCNDPDWEALEELVIPDAVEFIGAHAFSGCTALKRIEISAETVKRLGQKMIEQAFFGISGAGFDRKKAFRKCLPLRVLQGEPVELGTLREPLNTFFCKKNIRAELFPFLIENDMPQALAAALQVQKKLPMDELEAYLALAEKKETAELKAVLLDYQNGKFTADEKAQETQDAEDKALGVKEMTLADWKKIFKLSVKDGKATISGYKGDQPDVSIPKTVEKYTVSELKVGAFSGDKVLRSLTMEAEMKTIPEKAFERSEIRTLTLPPTVKTIAKNAFFGCGRLETIQFSEKLQTIESFAFRYCRSLTNLALPKGLKTIQSWAFANCGALQRVDLPNTVTEIAVNAFFLCEKLTIHAPAGSYAEQFAKEQKIPFVAE